MDIPHMFFASLTVAVIGIIIALINIAAAMRRAFSGDLGSRLAGKVIVIHVIAGLLYVLGAMGVIGFGIAWIVTYLKH